MLEAEPLKLSLEEFLCGADGADPWISQRFEDYIGDIDRRYDADALAPIAGHPDYAFAESSDSMLLLHRNRSGKLAIVGYYNTPGAVCIHEDHQGQGLGAELILYTALHLTGGPPTEGLDEQSFSEAGYAAHAAAYHLGVSRGLIVDRPRDADRSAG